MKQRGEPKQRGNRRYYRAQWKWANEFDDHAAGKWADFMHWHADRRGRRSGQSIKHRREHISILFKVYSRLADQWSRILTPYQIWIMIKLDQPQNDAVYVHSDNPNGTQFPHKFDSVEWTMKSHWLFASHYNAKTMDVGFNAHSKTYYIRAK